MAWSSQLRFLTSFFPSMNTLKKSKSLSLSCRWENKASKNNWNQMNCLMTWRSKRWCSIWCSLSSWSMHRVLSTETSSPQTSLLPPMVTCKFVTSAWPAPLTRQVNYTLRSQRNQWEERVATASQDGTDLLKWSSKRTSTTRRQTSGVWDAHSLKYSEDKHCSRRDSTTNVTLCLRAIRAMDSLQLTKKEKARVLNCRTKTSWYSF